MSFVGMSSCHHVICRNVIISSCHSADCHHVIISFVGMSLCHYVTCWNVIVSSCHLLECHCVIMSCHFSECHHQQKKVKKILVKRSQIFVLSESIHQEKQRRKARATVIVTSLTLQTRMITHAFSPSLTVGQDQYCKTHPQF